MAKIALLIGVSEYGPGLHPLPGTIRAVEAVQQVVQVQEKSSFDEVRQLLNPNPPVMREAIETLFSGCTHDDLALLFFCGHVVRDKSGQLYLATSITCNSFKVELTRVSAISASFVQDLMNKSPCQNQVLILDCCWTQSSNETMSRDDDDLLEIETQLGGKGRVILTSFTAIPNTLKREGFDHSVYTHYLVEGIRTGAADLDNDGEISLDELHKYASHKVEVAAPTVHSRLYPGTKREQISLFAAPVQNLKLQYRQEVERQLRGGALPAESRSSLKKLSETLQLTPEDITLIQAEVLKPYQQYQEKLHQYKRELAKVLSKDYPLKTQQREEFTGLQQFLCLRDEDVAPIEERMILQLANLSQSDTELRSKIVDFLDGETGRWGDNGTETVESLIATRDENDTEEQDHSPSYSEANLEPSSPPSEPLTESTLNPLVQLTHPTPASEDEVNEPAPVENKSAANVEPLTPEIPLVGFIPKPSVQLAHPTPALEDNVSEIAQSKSPNSESPASKMQQLEPTSMSPVASSSPVPTATLSADLADANTRSTLISIFPKKFLLLLGIGGILATLALSLLAHKPKPLLVTHTSTAQKTTPSSDTPPSPSASPESKECVIFVNGNIRSEPAAFRDNIVASLKMSLPVTAMRTESGWTEVKLPNGKLAWAYPAIISSDSEQEMETCLAKKGIKIKTIKDMLPPPSR